jgi:hypothetical protein
MVNPYFCYALSFLTALLTYLLGWSELYPPLSFALFSFVLLSIVTHVVLGLRLSRKKKPGDKP